MPREFVLRVRSAVVSSAMNKGRHLLAVILAAIVAAKSAYAMDYEDLRRGWFWYEDPIGELKHDESEEEDALPPIVSAPVDDVDVDRKEPSFMTAAWLRENIPLALDRAITDPTPDNVRAFAYLQRITFDKAETFANQFQQVVLSDPLLDENNRMPTATFARRAMRQERAEEEAAQMAYLSEHVGMFYFHDENCLYCVQQIPALEYISSNYGIQIMAISVGGRTQAGLPFPTRENDGHAKRFRIQQVPAIVLLWPPNNAAVISQNIIGRSDLVRRTLAIAEANGLLNDEVFEKLGISKPQMVARENLNASLFEENPGEFIIQLRRAMGYE